MIELLMFRIEGQVDYISNVAVYNRVDLLEIIYRETNVFLDNMQVLDEAASYGRLLVVEYLTRLGASCSTEAIDFASLNGNLEVVKYLHLNRSEGCNIALVEASYKGNFEMVKYLVENGLGMDRIEDAIDHANDNRYPDIARYLKR